jgi:hypothetical protein
MPLQSTMLARQDHICIIAGTSSSLSSMIWSPKDMLSEV